MAIVASSTTAPLAPAASLRNTVPASLAFRETLVPFAVSRILLLVVTLVVMALQTEVKLTRNTQGRWTFTMHKHPMRDSTLGQVISKLLTYLTGAK